MSMFKQVCGLAAILALAAIPSTVRGQAWHPFADPMEFDPDWQFMAPVDADYLEELSPRKRANIGWFGTYDREYILVSRSRQEAPNGGGDFTWGNRYEFGFMNEKESGWLFTVRHMGGPNIYDKYFQPRINQFNEDDVDLPATDPLFPSIIRNDPYTRERSYTIADSVNVGGYSSFEINKTFRMEPYRYGGILEPMLGIRYSNFEDYSLNQSYETTFDQPSDNTLATERLTEVLDSREWKIENRMLGGHLGFRYFNHVGRWTLSTELRAMMLGNYRRENQRVTEIVTQYDGVGAGSEVVLEQTTNTYIRPRNTTKLVPGFEVRAEAAYKLTKYIDLRGGVDFIDLAANIRRGTVNTGPVFGLAGENSVQMTGFNFGIAVNR